MLRRFSTFACFLLFAAIAILSTVCAAQKVPPQLLPPATEQLLLQVHAKGDQVYVCQEGATQFAWALKAPDAQLFDKYGKPFGKHFAGPAWEASDGSRVTGKASASAPSPDAHSIPWLLIDVANHEGNGMLSRVSKIQRLNTKGGKAPSSGCDARTLARKCACRIPRTIFFTRRNSAPYTTRYSDRAEVGVDATIPISSTTVTDGSCPRA